MATLAGQRAQFTWALNQYNLSESAEKRAFYSERMARYIAAAPIHGFTVDQVTQGQPYPSGEVTRFLESHNLDPSRPDAGPEMTEAEVIRAVQDAVDTSDVVRIGDGQGAVYAYGYRCAPDRLKVGQSMSDTVQRIVAQIGTGTPDRPTLLLEIRTHDCSALERALHAVLQYRGAKVAGAGREWFRTSRDEIVSIYRSIVEQAA